MRFQKIVLWSEQHPIVWLSITIILALFIVYLLLSWLEPGFFNFSDNGSSIKLGSIIVTKFFTFFISVVIFWVVLLITSHGFRNNRQYVLADSSSFLALYHENEGAIYDSVFWLEQVKNNDGVIIVFTSWFGEYIEGMCKNAKPSLPEEWNVNVIFPLCLRGFKYSFSFRVDFVITHQFTKKSLLDICQLALDSYRVSGQSGLNSRNVCGLNSRKFFEQIVNNFLSLEKKWLYNETQEWLKHDSSEHDSWLDIERRFCLRQSSWLRSHNFDNLQIKSFELGCVSISKLKPEEKPAI